MRALQRAVPSTYYRTALKYIPESTWNESTVNNTTISQNEPLSDAGYPASADVIEAGSGGASSCSINTTVDTNTAYSIGSCLSGYSKPFWQTGAGGAGGRRARSARCLNDGGQRHRRRSIAGLHR